MPKKFDPAAILDAADNKKTDIHIQTHTQTLTPEESRLMDKMVVSAPSQTAALKTIDRDSYHATMRAMMIRRQEEMPDPYVEFSDYQMPKSVVLLLPDDPATTTKRAVSKTRKGPIEFCTMMVPACAWLDGSNVVKIESDQPIKIDLKAKHEKIFFGDKIREKPPVWKKGDRFLMMFGHHVRIYKAQDEDKEYHEFLYEFQQLGGWMERIFE